MIVYFKRRSPFTKFETFSKKGKSFKDDTDVLKYIEEYNNRNNSWWIIDFKIESGLTVVSTKNRVL